MSLLFAFVRHDRLPRDDVAFPSVEVTTLFKGGIVDGVEQSADALLNGDQGIGSAHISHDPAWVHDKASDAFGLCINGEAFEANVQSSFAHTIRVGAAAGVVLDAAHFGGEVDDLFGSSESWQKRFGQAEGSDAIHLKTFQEYIVIKFPKLPCLRVDACVVNEDVKCEVFFFDITQEAIDALCVGNIKLDDGQQILVCVGQGVKLFGLFWRAACGKDSFSTRCKLFDEFKANAPVCACNEIIHKILQKEI